MKAAERLPALVERIEARLDAADDPLRVRWNGDHPEIGQEMGHRRRPWILWAPVPFLSTYMLRQGYGKRPDDDIPF